MTETTFNVQIPSQLLNLGLEQDEIQRRISEWLVFSLFSEGKVSSGKAGKLLGISFANRIHTTPQNPWNCFY